MKPTQFWLSLACLILPNIALGAGFEIPENTTRSVARGGTGAVTKADPSALYFNPALLPRANGTQILLDLNLLTHDVTFSRNDLVLENTTREFEPTSNTSGLFAAPFLAISHDFGLDDLGVAVGIFGPSAYGKQCFGEWDGSECQFEYSNSAKHMMLSSDIIEVYFTAGAGYRFDLGNAGALSVGVAAALAWQRTNFSVVVDEVQVAPPFNEDPANQSLLEARNLQDFQPTGFFGLTWEHSGFRVGASYRPPISWETTGEFELDLPETFEGLAEIEGNTLNFNTEQAGSLRAGVVYEHGAHPGIEGAPKFDIEFNFVWEDWSRLEYFYIEPDVRLLVAGVEQPLNAVVQPKQWKDTYSFRLGGSYAPLPWLTTFAGGAWESAAQPEAFTNVDFASWERTTLGIGAALHLVDWLDIELAYSAIISPDRNVTDGEVYQPIPTSGCTGPDYQEDACATKGTPPGNPQNEGEWSTFSQIFSVGTTFKF